VNCARVHKNVGQPLFKNYKQTIHLFIDTNSEVVLVFERDNEGLKTLVKFCLKRQVTHLPSKMHVSLKVHTRLRTAFFHFPYFDPDYPTSELSVTGLARVYTILNFNSPEVLIRNG
jgi:hypothetical protein